MTTSPRRPRGAPPAAGGPRAATKTPRLPSLVAGLTVLAVAGCTGGGSGNASTSRSTTTTSPATTSATSSDTSTSTNSTPAKPSCSKLTGSLSRDEQIGQLLMVGLNSASSRTAIDKVITDNHVGGVVLLGGWNGSSTVSATTKHLKSLTGKIGPLLAVDQEGGAVQQLKGTGFSTIPPATDQGLMDRADLTKAATGWARQLAAVGINMNLAPVADTVPAFLGTGNAPIGYYHREYGNTPLAVATGITAFINGMHAGKVASGVKHFPGLGRIRSNTDVSAFDITDSVTTTADPFLKPFASGIKAGADFVMVSSAWYPKIDPDNQAVFSAKVIRDLLRGKFTYEGVVITDDVGAAVSVSAVPVGDRATRFIAAGGDIVLTADAGNVPTMVAAIKTLMGTDRAFAAKVTASAERVLRLKASRGLASCSP